MTEFQISCELKGIDKFGRYTLILSKSHYNLYKTMFVDDNIDTNSAFSSYKAAGKEEIFQMVVKLNKLSLIDMNQMVKLFGKKVDVILHSSRYIFEDKVTHKPIRGTAFSLTQCVEITDDLPLDQPKLVRQ